MTKTQQTLLSRSRQVRADDGREYIYLNGIRECNAAKALVAAGLAKQYESHCGIFGGEYYVSPFTRRQGTTKMRFVAAGTLIF